MQRTSYTFDRANRQVRVQDANGRITTSIYDAADRISSTLNANGFRTTQVYDAAGRVIAVVDANGHRNSYIYDAAGRQTAAVDPIGRRLTYQYDAASRQTLRVDARGFRTSYVYDSDDRLVGRRYPNGARVTLAYDSASRRTVLSDATGRTSTTNDADGRTTLVINPAGLRLTHAYDAASRRKYLVEPDGARFTYTIDAAGRTSYVTNPQAQRATYTYDAASRVIGIHYANTTRTSYLYDNADRLLRVANLTSTNTTLSSFSYALDAVGNRKRVVEVTGNRVTWTYDNTYQLTNEQRSGSNSYNITYTYDPVGNRLALINGGVRTTSTYDAANELIKTQAIAGVTTITYDANGNTLLSRDPSNNRTSYTWDFENRMTQAALPLAIVDTFIYNGDGQRVQKQDSNGTTKHVWDAQNIVLETNGSNAIQVVYTLQPRVHGNLISQRRNGTTSFYLFDGMGSTTQLTDASGAVTGSYLYHSWGNVLLATNTTVNWFRFIGQLGYYYDSDTQSNYIRNRHFLPAIGRFVSTDPLTRNIAAASATFAQSYDYADNNPVNFVDPSGLTPRPTAPKLNPGPCADELRGYYKRMCSTFFNGANLFNQNNPVVQCIKKFCDGDQTGISITVRCPGQAACSDPNACAMTLPSIFGKPPITTFCPNMNTANFCDWECVIFHEIWHACADGLFRTVARKRRAEEEAHACSYLLYTSSPCTNAYFNPDIGLIIPPGPENCPGYKPQPSQTSCATCFCA